MLLAGLPMLSGRFRAISLAVLLPWRAAGHETHLMPIIWLPSTADPLQLRHARPRLARLSGVLFSLGHGAVVVATAMIVATLAQAWRVPEWLGRSAPGYRLFVLCLLAR